MEAVRHPLDSRAAVESATRALALLAGAAAIALFFAAAAAALSRYPLPLTVVLAAGLGLLLTLALALARYDAAVALGILLLAAVRLEPAPADLVFAVVIAVAVVTGRLHLQRVPLAVTMLVGAFLALNLVASFEVIDPARAVTYLGITLYLGVFGLWLAGYVDSRRRARLVLVAFVTAAVVSALAASLALFVHFPGSAGLVDGPRAKGLFKDPNVFGPFLVPAALFLLEEAAFPRLLRWRLATKLAFLSVVTVGIVFSFSRAAWLNLAVGALVMILVLALRRSGRRRALGVLAALLSACAILFAVIAVTASLTFLEERAGLQAYDTQRFGAQASGVDFALEYPLGVGPGQFERVSEISAHSTYVRAMAEEGFLGLFIVLALLLVTLGYALRNAFAGRDTYGIGSAALLAAWCGLLANSIFVDTLHWRHLWFVAALIWAGTAWRAARPLRSRF
jgi:O-antigen ligase